MKLGIVSGLSTEKKALGRYSSLVRLSGADASRAYDAARQLAEGGAELLVSAGLAGALDPALEPGALLLPRRVVTSAGAVYETYPVRPHMTSGDILGSDGIIFSAEEKRSLFTATGAAAVDMESHAVAKAAREASVPFVVIRAVADPAGQALPRAARNAVGPDGEVRTLRTILSLLKRPGDLPDLLRLGRQAAAALETLRLDGQAILDDLAARS
ncbi:MAG: hypothetical protein V2I43_07465 [Parvularcula sp.]|nr:hypothetical protein [Parvularcula sp.]